MGAEPRVSRLGQEEYEGWGYGESDGACEDSPENEGGGVGGGEGGGEGSHGSYTLRHSKQTRARQRGSESAPPCKRSADPCQCGAS